MYKVGNIRTQQIVDNVLLAEPTITEMITWDIVDGRGKKIVRDLMSPAESFEEESQAVIESYVADTLEDM